MQTKKGEYMKRIIFLLCILLCACSPTQPIEKIGKIGVPVEMSRTEQKKFEEYSNRFVEYSIKYCLYDDNLLKLDENTKCDYKNGVDYYISDPLPYFDLVNFSGVEYNENGARFLIFREDEIIYLPFADLVGRNLVGDEKKIINDLYHSKDNLLIINRNYSDFLVSENEYYEILLKYDYADIYEESDEKWALKRINQARQLRQFSFYKHKLVFDESKYIE